MKIYALTLSIFATCFLSATAAQTTSERKINAKLQAYETINALKDSGTLLVMLPLHRNEIAALRRKLSAADISNRDRSAATAALATLQTEVENTVTTTREVFKSVYHFSDIAFAWDTCASAFKRGQRNNIVLNQNLNGTIPYFNGGKFTAVIQYSRADNAWFLVDASLNPVGAPFPNRMNISKGGLQNGCTEIALDLQQLLTEFYNEALIRMPKLQYLRQKKELKAKLRSGK